MKDSKDERGRSVKVLGRSGILYEEDNQKYYIDSEMLVGPEYNLVIYADNVKPYDKKDKRLISFDKKKEIVSIAIGLFKSVGIKVLLHK